MSKRILSWVLSCALLLSCISGLTLFVSAESTVTAADLTPSAYDANQGAYFAGTFQSFNVMGWQKTGWTSWNGGKLANATGAPKGEAVDLSITLDYYWDKGAEGSDNNWWHFKTTNSDGSGTPDDGFGTFLSYGMKGGAWNEVTITREAQTLGMDGKDDL